MPQDVKDHIRSTGQCVGTMDVGEEDPETGEEVYAHAAHLEGAMFHPGNLMFSGLRYNYWTCATMGGDEVSFWTCCSNASTPNAHAQGCRSMISGMP